MSDARPPDRRTQIEQYLSLLRADLATPEVLAGLHELLTKDRSALRDYIRAMHFQASLHWLLEGEVPGDEIIRSEVRRQMAARRRRRFWQISVAVMAMGILIAVGTIATLKFTTNDWPVARIIGQLESSHAATWHGAGLPRAGMTLRERTPYRLTKGMAELRLFSGAVVILEAPAQWEFAGSNRLVLREGRLSADVPKSAIGFTVTAAGADAVDLGTRFGAAIDAQGQPEFHVFEGQVATSTTHLSPIVLAADHATRFLQGGKTQQPLAARPEAFQACLQYEAGVRELIGNARFSAEPLVHLRDVGSMEPGILHLFHERKAFTLPQDLSIISTELPVLDTATLAPRATLSAGTTIDTFFGHFYARGEGVIRCTITFDRPILGFILEPAALDAADPLFGQPGIRYVPPISEKTHRGAVLLPQQDRLNDEARAARDDRLELSPDHRTLSIFLHVNASDLDQIRILVAPQRPAGLSTRS